MDSHLGRARLIVEGPCKDRHAGDEVEVVGRFAAPPGPCNPGEADYAATLRDQRIRAVVVVAQDCRWRDVGEGGLAALVHGDPGSGPRLGAARLAAGTAQRARPGRHRPAAGRRLGDDPQRLGQIQTQRSHPCAGDLRLASGRARRFPLVDPAAARYSATLRGGVRGPVSPGLCPYDGRPASGDARPSLSVPSPAA